MTRCFHHATSFHQAPVFGWAQLTPCGSAQALTRSAKAFESTWEASPRYVTSASDASRWTSHAAATSFGLRDTAPAASTSKALPCTSHIARSTSRGVRAAMVISVRLSLSGVLLPTNGFPL